MALHRFLTVSICFLVFLLATIQGQSSTTTTGSSTVASTTGSSNVTGGGGNKTGPSNKTGIPYKGSLRFQLSAKSLNFSTSLNVTFNGTVGNPKGDKINITVASPKLNKTTSFEVQPFVLDKRGKPLNPKNSNKDYYEQLQNNEYFNEWNTYETYRNASKGNSSGKPAEKVGVICFKLP
ncbi:hypothetical protein TNCT_583901 [Trichonephila clavata]|uniref:Uncharacterized protein n=1 Tax=Trichonephila clavata TaxID=2740835 RepID=A0A8X6LPB4_TRICU|nr:hypothetical protein TNCT_583901 [Trichonephila clavata]